MPDSPSVRERIINQVLAALATVENVGHVAKPAVEFGRESAGTNCLLKVYFTADISDRDMPDWPTDMFVFNCHVEVEVPKSVLTAMGLEPLQACARLHSRLTRVMTSMDGPSSGGQWPENGNLLASWTMVIGGGQPYFRDLEEQSLETESAFMIFYRHALGQPEVPV